MNERICKICNAEIETKEHFLRFCPTYDVIRFRYFGNLPTLQWKKVLKCEEEETAFKLANYLMKAIKIRQTFIDNTVNTNVT